MITLAEARKLGAVRTVHPGVLSLYLTVPLDPVDGRSLPARVDDLIAAAESARGDGPVAAADRTSVLERLEINERDWLGHTVAMFACADARLSEAFPLPCHLPDLAVLGIRPHIRPLLVAVRRCPAYQVAVVDRRHARLFHIADGKTETVTVPVAATVRGTGFGGWYGLEAYHVQQRIAQLARRHYREVAALVEEVMTHTEREPLVIGGHEDGIRQLLTSLPPGVRKRCAGSFAADPRTLTPARVRELAAPLVARWAEQRAEHLVSEVIAVPPGGLKATGLRACLAAVNARAVQTLIVPAEGLVPGFECGTCGAMSVAADGCPDWRASALPVPDVLAEMVARTLDDGGEVCPVYEGSVQIAARLRFPVAAG